MKIVEPKATHRVPDGIIEGKDVKKTVKLYKDAKSFYANEDVNLADDVCMYTVYSYQVGDPNEQGNLIWGLSILEPVLVNGECNMTRGHFHEDEGCAEFYQGLSGEGLLMLMDGQGEIVAEKVFPGSLHYIAGNLAHRLICTGDVPMKVVACWPSTAGHDYARVEKHPFTARVFKKDNELIIEER
ncbi:glucose-6-phosphate isomerase [Erysipelotrichaceae bacterium MTC7]|nr:glucose-6-phosphate isomerase [Erysipelotrichaceae bacterium MTC7]